jgi:hypothetical protein
VIFAQRIAARRPREGGTRLVLLANAGTHTHRWLLFGTLLPQAADSFRVMRRGVWVPGKHRRPQIDLPESRLSGSITLLIGSGVGAGSGPDLHPRSTGWLCTGPRDPTRTICTAPSMYSRRKWHCRSGQTSAGISGNLDRRSEPVLTRRPTSLRSRGPAWPMCA